MSFIALRATQCIFAVLILSAMGYSILYPGFWTGLVTAGISTYMAGGLTILLTLYHLYTLKTSRAYISSTRRCMPVIPDLVALLLWTASVAQMSVGGNLLEGIKEAVRTIGLGGVPVTAWWTGLTGCVVQIVLFAVTAVKMGKGQGQGSSGRG
ncbi:hypothetical protein EX30DRAFT_398697 [Ascodesmis nigricans]|uniref:Uncharacterized protein n=1 Tax=Ascodesmis nigricans TaxID=341454 RepID=A0A4S2MJW9_9PEZI|nr:hypothetical protein EX30DRAFT_398697 [Ascodesmis nigricans]